MKLTPRDEQAEIQRCAITGESVKLMAQWHVRLSAASLEVELRRGMTVTSCEGEPAGRLAAVAVSDESSQALCLILSHLPVEGRYQALPISWIRRVEGENCVLNVNGEIIRGLPAWHAP